MENQLPTPRTLVLLAVVCEGGLGLLAAALGWGLGPQPLESIGWTLSAAAWGTAASLPMLLAMWICVRIPLRPFIHVVRVVEGLIVPMFRPCRVRDLVLISVLAGLGEEMLFRGFLQEAVAGWVGGPPGIWVGLIAASVLFGLIHPITPTYAVLAGLMGLYLGGLWIASGNLLVPITAHAVYDLVALVYLVKLRDRKPRAADRPECGETPEWLP
jgi:membrane protease YdiL (CAAX protease family)